MSDEEEEQPLGEQEIDIEEDAAVSNCRVNS
jgi:hypothetical protein